MLKLILNSFKEINRYIISALLFIFSYLFLIVLLSVYSHYVYNINLLQNEEINRGIEVIIDEDDAISIFKDYDNIEQYYPMYNNRKMLYCDKNINLNTYDNIDLVHGSGIKNSNEVIISKSFSKSIELEENNYNIELNFKYDGEEYNFIIVGVTDNNNADVYLKTEEFKKIFDAEASSYYVLIDDYANVNKFINQMLNSGYIANLYNATSVEELNSLINLKNTYIGIMIVIVLLIFCFLFAIVKNMIQYETKNIAVLKAVGYRNRVILFIIFSRLLIVNIFSYLFTLFILVFIYFMANNVVLQYNLSLKNLIYYNSFIMIVISFLIIVNVFAYKRKIKKMDVVDVLQDY